MTNPMLAELDEVVLLSERATPGLLQPEFVEAYNVRAAHGGIFAQIHNLKGRHGMGGRVDGNEAANNARLIAQAINFLRTHHAALADMAKRLEAAERECEEQARLNGMGAERELALRARLEAAERDSKRLDWLADRNNSGGQVLLPTASVEANLHDMRAAIDHAMEAAIDAAQEGEG